MQLLVIIRFCDFYILMSMREEDKGRPEEIEVRQSRGNQFLRLDMSHVQAVQQAGQMWPYR